MEIGKMALGLGGLVAVAAIAAGVTALALDHGSSSSRAVTDQESFCSVATQTNGSRLVELARTGQLGDGRDLRWIVNGTAHMALPAIRRDMTLLRDGIVAHPEHPSAAMLAAAARVDAFVVKTCTGAPTG